MVCLRLLYHFKKKPQTGQGGNISAWSRGDYFLSSIDYILSSLRAFEKLSILLECCKDIYSHLTPTDKKNSFAGVKNLHSKLLTQLKPLIYGPFREWRFTR